MACAIRQDSPNISAKNRNCLASVFFEIESKMNLNHRRRIVKEPKMGVKYGVGKTRPRKDKFRCRLIEIAQLW